MCGHKKNADRKPIIKLKALVSPCYNNRKQPALSIYIGTHPRKDFKGGLSYIKVSASIYCSLFRNT